MKNIMLTFLFAAAVLTGASVAVLNHNAASQPSVAPASVVNADTGLLAGVPPPVCPPVCPPPQCPPNCLTQSHPSPSKKHKTLPVRKMASKG